MTCYEDRTIFYFLFFNIKHIIRKKKKEKIVSRRQQIKISLRNNNNMRQTQGYF